MDVGAGPRRDDDESDHMIRSLMSGVLMFLMAAAPVLADPLNTRLEDRFEGQDFAPEGGLYYKDNAEQRAGSVEFQGADVFEGKGAIKLSVRPLCNALEDGCSERAEIWEKPELRVPYESPVWFGFAVKFADPIPDDDHRYLIAQWKREIEADAEGDYSPFLAFRMRNGKLFITVETDLFEEGATTGADNVQNACATGGTPVWLRPKVNQMRAFVAGDSAWTPEDGGEFTSCTTAIQVTRRGELPKPSSGWIDFAVLSKPGPGGDGHIEIFANKIWVATVKGRIGHQGKGLGPNQYFKFGPYRAAREGVWSLYYDDFRRSPDCRDVLRDETLCTGVR